MMLDAECLLEAKVENVERLAVSLGLRLPPYKGNRSTYARKLVRLVLKQLEEDRYPSYRRHGWAEAYDA